MAREVSGAARSPVAGEVVVQHFSLLLGESSSEAPVVAETAPQSWVSSAHGPVLRASFPVSFRGEFVSKRLRMSVNGIMPFNMDGLGSRLL